ncbi:EAL domain-containing protein [Vibrio hangzhouensis]|uniref:EAL domain, c-di-GMP-specific phosphodiesterase class I (Or its enzymatically inactive variant) n=1 Tax=Vibrio hangzhouensis TaxID=462991 RepID=A0A1H6A5W4_9VIBR|nr:EAL domain-containing protein [Vibrio hangzhouensis]SEG44133.1 EAL domain, c-di-GMP-specific phosphodiesterase class I (or its enzymatically inactive variant) [Vibrio hangzhouensis]
MYQIDCSKICTGIRVQSTSDTSRFAELEFVFQPIQHSTTEDLVAYELLSKVLSQSGDCYENSDFFEDVDNELIKKIVVAQVQFINKMFTEQSHLISLNITFDCLLDSEFVDSVIEQSSRTIAFEVNSTTFESMNDCVLRNLAKLRRAGHQLWLDDFSIEHSTASSTFGHLVWDSIKIDRCYLFDNALYPNKISSDILKLKPHTKNGVIFDGVETELHYQYLRHSEISLQGYLISYPLDWHSIDRTKTDKKQEVGCGYW